MSEIGAMSVARASSPWLVLSLCFLASLAFGERIELKTEAASCVLETRGARVTSYKTAGQGEILWNDDPVQIEDSDWAHGGIPLCWPLFSRDEEGKFHGFAWKRDFKVVSRAASPARSELVLLLETPEATLTYTVLLRDKSLKLTLETRNVSQKPFAFSAALHPYFQAGSIAHKVCKADGEAVFVSCCNGNKGHQWMNSSALAARRYGETQASAKVLGINKYIVLGYNDCEIEATMLLRNQLTRLIRQEAPNMLVAHRCSDYHADHRAVALAVRDAAYLIGVPLYCPETPVPEQLSFFLYGGDGFSEPRPFRADLMVSDDDVLDVLLEAWACHESQKFEWLPPDHGFDPAVDVPPASDHAGRLAFIRDRMMPGRPTGNGRRHRQELDAAWGGKGPKYAEVFELSEYGRPPEPKEIAFLRALGAKWVGPEPKVFQKGESTKTQTKII